MRHASSSDCIDYGDVRIAIKLERSRDRVFGHADLFKADEFKGRISLGSNRARADVVRERLRCLAKAKVDVWKTVASVTAH